MKLFRRPGRRNHSAERITAYVDGELSSDERVRFEAALEESPDLRQAVETERALKQMLRAALPEAPAPRSFALTEEMLGRPQPAPARGWLPAGAMRIAQATAAGAVIGFVALTMIDITSGTPGNERDASRAVPASMQFEAAGLAADDVKTDGQSAATPGDASGYAGTPFSPDSDASGEGGEIRASDGDRESAPPLTAFREPDGGLGALRLAQIATIAVAILSIGVYLAARRNQSPRAS